MTETKAKLAGKDAGGTSEQWRKSIRVISKGDCWGNITHHWKGWGYWERISKEEIIINKEKAEEITY